MGTVYVTSISAPYTETTSAVLLEARLRGIRIPKFAPYPAIVSQVNEPLAKVKVVVVVLSLPDAVVLPI